MPDDLSDDEKNETINLTKTQTGEQKYHVRVGLPGGTVHELEVDGNAQLSTVVSRIRDIENLSPLTKRIRLIVAGKLFSDHSQIIKDVVEDGGFIHCAISDFNRHATSGATTAATAFLTSSSSSSITDPHVRSGQVHIPIDIDVDVNGSTPATTATGTTNNRHHHHHDPNDSINVNADGEVRIVIPNLNSQTAFDRLLRAGFTPDEIRMIRRHVRALRREARGARASATLTAATTAATTVATETYDPTNEVDVQHNSPSPSSNNNNNGNNEQNAESRGAAAAGAGDGGGGGLVHAETTTFVGSGGEGTNGDFLMGCIFGYLLGIIILVLLLDNHATRRWRVGIIAGVATNCAFGVLRSNLYLHASTFPAH